ncbi:MAG TPA: YciI family protein [Acidimicrobiales bacterium]|nr:YciI family protein [Acidimicrobiales bacterium]
MAEWVYFLHAPRDDFGATMTAEEQEAFDRHFEWLRRLHGDGVLILAGPTLGRVNTGINVFEAPDEAAALRILQEDPVVAGGFARGELRPFRVSLLRGRE